MIFRRISYQLAAQFMAFVFAMLLVTGAVFLTADVVGRDRFSRARLERQLRPVLERRERFGAMPQMPPFQRDRVRIVDASGTVLFAGSLYENLPFRPDAGIVSVERGEESYDVLTAAVVREGRLVGYVQVADRTPPDDIGFRILAFLLISGAVSGLTFGVGLFFARRSLRPAQRMMQRLEQFTQDASHELKTPLTAVSTSLDMALLEKGDNRGYVRAAKKDIKDVFVLVERLLELARLDALALQTEPTDLAPLVGDVADKHAAAAEEKGVRIVRELSPARVDADPALLRQVVGNLLSNAIKFNAKGGTVTLRLTPDALAVEDTGKGIAPEALPRIFDRFYQEDEARSGDRQGMGLGLALVKRIVELHGWTVEAESGSGKGTTFTVRFG